MADESEEFEFRLRAEKESQAPKSTEAKDTGWLGAAKGVGDVALTMGSGVVQQAIGVPKHLAQLAESATAPLSRRTPEEKAETAKKDAEPGITEKLQKLVAHQPQTEEGKYLLGQIQSLLSPVTELGEEIHKGIASVAGEPAANVAGDVVGLAGLKGLGKGSVASKALKGATSTESKVQGLIENLSGGRSLAKSDVGKATQKAVGATTAEAKKVGTQAYDELSKAMGPTTPVALTESAKASGQYATRTVLDPKVKAFSEKLKSVGSMSFEDLKTLRTEISDNMGSDRNVNRQLRGLRDAVTKDIEETAKGLSPEAKKAWDVANAKWKAFTQKEDALNKVLGKKWQASTPTDLYQKVLTAANKDPSKITEVMGAVKDPAIRKQFAASVLHHMSDTGGEFDGDKMIRVWENMNPQARKVLFSSVGGGYEENMTKLIHNLKRIKEGRSGMVKELSGIGVAAVLSRFIPGGTAVVGAVTVGREAYKFGPRIIEQYLTSPRGVRYLAEKTSAIPEKATQASIVGSQQTDPQRYTLADQ